MADKTALVLRIDGTIGEQKSRQPALDRARPGARRGGAEDPAARHPRRARRGRRGSEDLEPRPRPRRDAADGLLDAARDRRRDRSLQGERQESRRLGLGLRPAPVLRRGARRRGLPASARRRQPHRLRQPAQLLQGRARQARRHRQPDARRHLQERGEPYIANEPSAPALEADKRALRLPLEDVHRRGREGEEARARRDHARHRRRAGAAGRGRRRRGQARARREAGRRPQDARRVRA